MEGALEDLALEDLEEEAWGITAEHISAERSTEIFMISHCVALQSKPNRVRIHTDKARAKIQQMKTACRARPFDCREL